MNLAAAKTILLLAGRISDDIRQVLDVYARNTFRQHGYASNCVGN